MLGLSKMRLCVLFALISVVISIPTVPLGPKENAPVGPQKIQEDVPGDLEMLDEEDMKQLLKDLFISSPRDSRQLELDEDADDGEDGDAADVADVTDDADKTLEYEEAEVDSDSKVEASEEEVARFNNYIDAIYRRMNAALRAKMMDPMTLNLDDKQKKKSSKPRSLGKREAEDDGDEVEKDAALAEDELLDRAGKAKGKGRKGSGAAAHKNKKNKKGKKEDKEDKVTKKAERLAAKKKKQEKKMKKQDLREEKKEKKMTKQELREKKRAEKKKEKAGASRRQSRSGQKNRNRRKQSNNKNKKSRNTNNKNKKTKSTNNKNNNNKGRSGNARNNVKDEKMMGSLSGIATLRREGDVMVKEEETHKIITSEFNVGPLQLEVSKMYGKGQARTVKSAKAITEVMSGTMTLKVKPDGSAHVKKVVFKEPENVDVKGSLSDNKPRNLRYLKNSVNKMRPLAAIRVLKTARYVLKSPNSSAN